MKIPARTFKYVAALVVFAVLFAIVDLQQFASSLQQLTPAVIAYLALLAVALVYVSALKWKLFLEQFGVSPSAYRLSRLYLVGYFVNLLLPSFIGGDAVRSWYASGQHISRHEAVAATILERYTGLVAMIALALTMMWSVDAVTWQIQLAVVLVAFAGAAGTAFALSPRAVGLIRHVPACSTVLPHIEKVQTAFRMVRKAPRILFLALILSVVFHVLAVLNVHAAAIGVGWEMAALRELFVVLPLILLIGALPLTPNGLGIQEGAYVYFLVSLGASPAQALAIGLVLRAKLYVLALLGGICWLRARGER